MWLGSPAHADAQPTLREKKTLLLSPPPVMVTRLSAMIPQIVSLVLGCALIAFLWWLAFRRIRALRRAVITDGHIVDMIPVESIVRPGLISHVPRLKFRAQDGTEHMVTRVYSSFRSRPEFRVGQRVRIAYDPETYSAEILKPAHTVRLLVWLVLLTAAVVGILFVTIVD